MKYFDKKMLVAFVTSSAMTLGLNGRAMQVYAQSGNDGNTSDTIIISELPQTGTYLAEGGTWAHRLGLTDDQMEQLVSLKSDYEVRTAKQKAELKADRKKMMLLMTEPNVDKDAVLSLNEKIKSLKSDLSDAHVNQMISAMNVMTPKQREEMRHHMLAHMISHHRQMGHKYHKGAGDHRHHTA